MANQRLIACCFTLAALSSPVLGSPVLWAQDGSATGELVRSGDVRYVEANTLRDDPAEESAEGHLSDETPTEVVEPETFTRSLEPETFRLSADDEASPVPLQRETQSLQRETQPRKLAGRGKTKTSPARAALTDPTESLITMGGSLCVVLTLFFGLAWLTRRGLPKGSGKLPGEVIEVLGKAPLTKGQELQLIRVGSRLVLICVTPHGAETLTEIVERTEVDRISAICRSNNPASMTAAFNQVLTGVGREPASGFAGNSRTSSDRRGGRSYA